MGPRHQISARIAEVTSEGRAKGVAPENHTEPWLVSSIDPDDNPNHDFALDQAVKAI